MPCKVFSYSWYCPLCQEVNTRTYPVIDEKLPSQKHEKCDSCRSRIDISFASRRGVKYIFISALREPEAGEAYSFSCLQCARILSAKWGRRNSTPQGDGFMALVHGLMTPKGKLKEGATSSADGGTGSSALEQPSQTEGATLPIDAPADALRRQAPAAQPVKLHEKRLPEDEFRVKCKCGCCYHGYYRNKRVTLDFLSDEEAIEEKLEAVEQEARRKDRVALENRNAANARRRRLS